MRKDKCCYVLNESSDTLFNHYMKQNFICDDSNAGIITTMLLVIAYGFTIIFAKTLKSAKNEILPVKSSIHYWRIY